MPKPHRKIINFSLPPELDERVRAYAETYSVNMSRLIQKLLREHLDSVNFRVSKEEGHTDAS